MASIRILKAMLKDWKRRVAEADDSIKRARARREVKKLKAILEEKRKI